jgi:hypothetical protein
MEPTSQRANEPTKKNLIAMLICAVGLAAGAVGAASYPWLKPGESCDALEERIAPPAGCVGVAAEAGSFGEWLRRLPLKKGAPPVLLYDGREKGNQSAHVAVVQMDVGGADLQQCADAVIRLRAEYLWSVGAAEKIAFRFTSGDEASYARWAHGFRPLVSGSRVAWGKTAAEDRSYKGFRAYLTTVFRYAGSYSLSREMRSVPRVRELRIGDVFIRGGFPGHAVIVVDLAEDGRSGARFFLLAQSYMPAQEVHVLRNPGDPALGPWYPLDFGERLVTPEWTFEKNELKRFP